MTDLWSVWGGTVEVDWSDSGLYDHSVSDVSEGLSGLRFRWGAAERSNPDRPIVDYGRGMMRLVGDQYVLGVSEMLSAVELQSRHLMRITPPNWALPIEARCTFDIGRSTAGRSSTFQLEGLGVENLTSDLDVVQPTVGVLSDSSEFVSWMLTQLGLSMLSVRSARRIYDRFRFVGRRGELVSQLAATLSTLPVPGRGGALRLHDPSMPTSSPGEISGTSVAVLASSSRLDVAHVRNQISIGSGDTSDTSEQAAVRVVQIDAPAVLGPAGEISRTVTVWDGTGRIVRAVASVDGLERLVPDEIVPDPDSDGRWLVVDEVGDDLWRINPDDPSGDLGLVGALPTGLTSSGGIGYGDGRWLVVDDSGNELWRINPDDPDDTSGDFGLVGTLPTGLTTPRGIGYGDGRWLVVDDVGDELWRINPDDPDDTSGDYGLVGALPTGLTSPGGIGYGDGRWLVVDASGNELWRINPDDPDDTSGDYGLVGALPTGLTVPRGIGYGDGRWLVVSGVAGNKLWWINPDDPDDTSGDFGLVGTLPTGLIGASGISIGPGWLASTFTWQTQTADTADETSTATATPADDDTVAVVVDVRDNILTTGPVTLTTPTGTQDHTPRGWSDRNTTEATTNPVSDPSELASIFGLRATITVAFDVTVPVTVTNQASIDVWGPRPLHISDWLRHTDTATAEAALQPIIDYLGQPRRLHTIDIAIPQPDAALDALIDTEPGNYHHIIIGDMRLPTSINTVGMVMACELTVTAAQRAALRLLLIESGGRAYSDAYSAGYG